MTSQPAADAVTIPPAGPPPAAAVAARRPTPIWTEGYVHVVKGFDAAYCPDPVPPGYDWCMVYAGGSSATHPWEQAELDRVAHLPRLPVWVPTPGHEGPIGVADEFLGWLHDHGVPALPAASVPVHVMWDMETGKEPDASWLNKAATHVAKHGYFNVVYGSKSTLFDQPARDGYIVADPTNVLHLTAHPAVAGTQYLFDLKVPGGVIDEDVATVALAKRMWMPHA